MIFFYYNVCKLCASKKQKILKLKKSAMYPEKENQRSFENNQMYNEIDLSKLFSIKRYSDLITNSNGSSGLQLDPKVLKFFLELLGFLNLADLIRIADDFNLKKEQSPDRKLSLFISHNNEIMNGDISYHYDNPGDICPIQYDSSDDSIIIDFVGSKPVCIRINITFFDSFDNSENYVRYTLPVAIENELDEDHRYIINGIAKVHNMCDPEEVEDFFEELEEVDYNNNITVATVFHLQNTNMGKAIVAMTRNDETYFPNVN